MKQSKKKIIKSFTNFQTEENWLQDMYTEGWMLEKYDIETVEDNKYEFNRLTDNEEKKVFKIDYREFTNSDEYNDYIDLFKESGWMSLSTNKSYYKHIFYTDANNKNVEIFSDKDSIKDREKRKMNSALINFASGCFVFIITTLLYMLYEQTFIFGGGLVVLVGSFKYILDYLNHKKVYKSYSEV